MKSVEEFCNDNNIVDSKNIEALLALSDYSRELIMLADFEQISKLIKYSLNNNALEAFSWIISVLEETYNINKIDDFSYEMGRTITNYDNIMKLLDVNYDVYANPTLL